MLIRKFHALVALMAVVPGHLLAQTTAAQSILGYSDFSKQAAIEAKFLSVPSAKLAGEELKTLTAVPHLAATPEDRNTADYVAQKFRAAGLDTEIVPYRVLPGGC
jgi:N-acetylated-alpha-linked acidic dipeptidase